MLFGIRSFVALSVLAAAAALPAQAQRGGAPRRPAYGYFRYRIARPELGPAWRGDVRLRAMERVQSAMERVRVRQFELQNRLRERRPVLLQDRMRMNRFDLENRLRDRRFDLEDRAFRRQLENQDRALLRLRERQDRGFAFRPFLFPRRSRPI